MFSNAARIIETTGHESAAPSLATISAPPEVMRSQANIRMRQILETGTRSAGPTIERVLSQVPTDRMVRATGLEFNIDNTGTVTLEADGAAFGLHKHALGQMLGRVGIPAAYASDLSVPNETDRRGNVSTDNSWKRDLIAHTLREHFGHDPARYLVRSVGSEVRGFLSDKFSRLDSRPLLDAFVQGCTEVGAVPFEGIHGALRSSVRAVIPQIFEPTPGECLLFGLSWANSDFGAATYSVSAFVLRLVCLNGATAESALKQIHLGGRLPDDLAFSERTYALDTKTMVSATRDVIRGALAPAKLDARMRSIRDAATETGFNIDSAIRGVSKALTKAEAGKVRDAFDGPDVVMLPEGKSTWRFSNALSWIANATEDPERKIEIQALAGSVLPKLA